MYSKFIKSKHLDNAAGRDERQSIAMMLPAFEIAQPETLALYPASPLIYASPHSGRVYPPSWLKACRLPLRNLRQAEDAFTDRLFADAPKYSAPLLTARFPRSFVDVNRAPTDLPPQWSGSENSPRGAAGLGVIPMAIGEGLPIYSREPSEAQGRHRLKALYHPYHAALSKLIARAQSRSGHAILIDCHSMPGFGPLNKRRADFILGDNYGKACTPELINRVSEYLKSAGYSVTRNYPYAGGYVTRHYGRPDYGVQGLQIEINRDLYLNPVTLKPKPGFDALKADINGLMADLARAFTHTQNIAAE